MDEGTKARDDVTRALRLIRGLQGLGRVPMEVSVGDVSVRLAPVPGTRAEPQADSGPRSYVARALGDLSEDSERPRKGRR